MIHSILIDTKWGTYYGIESDLTGKILRAVQLDHNIMDKFRADTTGRTDWSWSTDTADYLENDLKTREADYQLDLI